MNKISLSHLGIDVFHEQLDNGLNIYVAPKKNVNNIYATFTTNYGSNQSEFVPLGEKKMITVPLGIAHFLEHKMFEQEDNIDPFAFFGERGSDANANTNNFKTTYLFSGPEFFEDNINFLLDYVQSPYFTDENVEKEKGIIEQEIKMYLDDPYTRLSETIFDTSLIENPMKDPIIGNIKSVRSITKEDLYKCYNTFYHPSNMYVVVTGNVVPEDVINLIKNNQEKKRFKDYSERKIKKYKEPDKVRKNKEVLKLNVSIPKVSVNYKINLSKFKDINIYKLKAYMTIFLDIKLGTTSLLNERLRESKLIAEPLENASMDVDSHFILSIVGETDKKDELIAAIKEEMNSIEISEEELERKKKTLISSLIYMSDSIFRINHKIVNDINRYGKLIDNNFELIKELNIKEFNKIIKQIDFSNNNIVIIDKKDISNLPG